MIPRFANQFFRRGFRTYLHRPGDAQPQKVTLIEGVGVGPEICRSVRRVFDAAHCPIQWDILKDFSFEEAASKELLKQNETVLLGVLAPHKRSKYTETTEFYKFLNLYANIVHCFSVPGFERRHQNVDIVIIRENTEGEYSGVEHEVYPGVVESLKIITYENSFNIAKFAFEYAYLAGRNKVTAVHKANIMKLADGLFLEAVREVAKKYPHIEYEEMIIDNCAMQLVKNPWQFDVMLMPNLYGSIVQNIATGITGGPGLTAGANIGTKYSLFEQGCRYTGTDIAGKNQANPSALIFASVLMLRRLGLPRFADLIENCLQSTLAEQKVRTIDLGGNNTTEEFTNEVVRKISEQLGSLTSNRGQGFSA